MSGPWDSPDGSLRTLLNLASRMPCKQEGPRKAPLAKVLPLRPTPRERCWCGGPAEHGLCLLGTHDG